MTNEYFEHTVRPHARLAILRLLEGAPNYTSNVSMMASLLPGMGIVMTRAQVEAEVAWLVEQGLARSEVPTASLIVVTATLAGVEVAQGIGRHEGVQRPRPGV